MEIGSDFNQKDIGRLTLDQRIALSVDSVLHEIDSSDLSPEHKDMLRMRAIEAKECANGTLDKVGKIATVTSLSELALVKLELRLPEKISMAIEKEIPTLIESNRKMFEDVLDRKLGNTSDTRSIFNTVRSEIATRRERFWKYCWQMYQNSHTLVGVIVLFIIYKIIKVVVTALGPDLFPVLHEFLSKVL